MSSSSRFRRTKLHDAVIDGRLVGVREALAAAADVNAVDVDNQTALHWAIWKGSVELIALLLESGCSTTVRDYKDRTPLECVRAYPRHDGVAILREFVKHGQDPTAALQMVTKPPATAATAELVKYLLLAGANGNAVDPQGEHPLHVAVQNKMTPVAVQLLQSGVDVNARDKLGNSPMHYAAQMASEELVRELYSAGADVNALNTLNSTPLHLAMLAPRQEVIQLLLDYGADATIKDGQAKLGGTVLHAAANRHSTKLVQSILRAGVDVNATDAEGTTALHIAAGSSENNCRELLWAGADQHLVDNAGKSALHCAAGSGSYAAAMLLIADGADFTLLDYDGKSVLHYAVKASSTKLVDDLLERGVNVNTTDRAGNSPLILAAQSASDEVLNLLLDKGADVHVTNEQGDTVAYCAARAWAEKVMQRVYKTEADRLRSLAEEALERCNSRFGIEATDGLENDVEKLFNHLSVTFSSRLVPDGDATSQHSAGLAQAWTKQAKAEHFGPLADIPKELERLMSKTSLYAPAETTSKRRISAVYQCFWDLPAYLEEELGLGPLRGRRSLSSMLVLVGTLQNAYCTSSSHYAKAIMQSRFGDLLLCELEGKSPHEKSWTTTIDDIEVSCNVLVDGCTAFNLDATAEVHLDFAEQLCWMAAVFRRGQKGSLTRSNVSFEQDAHDKSTFNIRCQKLQSVSPKIAGCWSPLFQGCALGYGLPVPYPRKGKGLELPFPLMVKLSRAAELSVSFDRPFLHAFSRVLVPVEKLGSDTIQWHLISSPDDDTPITGVDIRAYEGQWLENGDVEKVMRARTFLGYCSRCVVRLGTAGSGYAQVDYSRLDTDRGALTVSVKTATIGTSGAGFVTAEMELALECPRSMIVNMSLEEDEYGKNLRAAQKMSLILYDADTKQAWLVPIISVLLHMILGWTARHAREVHIPNAELGWDGARAAHAVLVSSSKVSITQSAVTGQPYPLWKQVQKFWSTILKIDIGLQDTKRGSRFKLEMGLKRLVGWEYNSILEEDIFLQAKVEKLHFGGCGWDALASQLPVLVCRGLGLAVEPQNVLAVCAKWRPLPRDNYLLVAPVKCLQEMARTRTSRFHLAEDVFWDAADVGRLFSDCDHAVKCSKQLQQLKSHKKKVDDEAELPAEGAVVFGRQGYLPWQ